MKLKELYLVEGQIKDTTGYVKWNWKSDLEDEEHEGYIPDGYSKKVLELSIMRKFLESTDAKKAELIFLDPSPNEGPDDDLLDEERIERLQKFYRKFGFRNRPGSDRMWLVQKGSISDDQLPK